MTSFKQTKTRQAERGNVFLIIMIGVVLFAALAFTVSQGLRSDNTTRLSQQEVALAASDILSFAQKIERSVNRLRRRAVSESDISFISNATGTDYQHGAPQPDSNKIFHPSGASVSWQEPPEGANDGSTWHFTGHTCITDIGTGATGCDSDSAANEELLIVLPNVVDEVCAEINTRLNIGTTPTDSGGSYSATRFTGTYADGTEIILGSSQNAACYADGSNNHFYYVLLAR
jgi:hypothetical protein